MDEFIRENPIRIDDLGVPLFSETPMCESLRQFFAFVLSMNVLDPKEKKPDCRYFWQSTFDILNGISSAFCP